MISFSAAFITIIFVLTVLLTAGFLLTAFWTAHQNIRLVLLSAAILAVWMALQGGLAGSGFYLVNDGTPRFALALVPALLLIAAAFFFRSSRESLLNMALPVLTLLSIVRIPVEVVIDWWFHNG